MKRDCILIRDLCLEARVGVYSWERKVRQQLVMDLELEPKDDQLAKAASTDNLKDAIDYTEVVRAIENVLDGEAPQLIETLAEKIVQKILQDFSVCRVGITLQKPSALANANTVGVRMERQL